MKQVQFSAGRDSNCQTAFEKPAGATALRRCEGTANRKLEKEGDDEMSDEGRDRIDGEEELAAPGWRVRAGPRN